MFIILSFSYETLILSGHTIMNLNAPKDISMKLRFVSDPNTHSHIPTCTLNISRIELNIIFSDCAFNISSNAIFCYSSTFTADCKGMGDEVGENFHTMKLILHLKQTLRRFSLLFCVSVSFSKKRTWLCFHISRARRRSLSPLSVL